MVCLLTLVAFSVSTYAQATKGPLLPENRIIAYYGNFYSKKMGVLGQYPEDEMLKMLEGEVAKWRVADPSKSVIPAIDYIAVTAQGQPGSDGKYRNRMPDGQIQKALSLAEKINGITILDVQIGQSDVATEIAHLEPYLKMPNVMLALDPEFAMGPGEVPGKKIGTLDATQINYAINYLAKLVKDNNLPPKILVVHRFTAHMVTNAHQIKPVPEVQVVMNMDGWGPQTLKADSYHSYIASEPVQFTGMKLFYGNDMKPPSTGLFTPEQLMKFKPEPVFIMFQ
jgi:hypothetical protein